MNNDLYLNMLAGVCHKGHVPVLGFFEPPLVFVNNNNNNRFVYEGSPRKIDQRVKFFIVIIIINKN